jgi:hypothetical protein
MGDATFVGASHAEESPEGGHRGVGAADWGRIAMTYDQFVHTVEQELERLGYDELDGFAEEQRRVLIWRAAQFAELGFGSVASVTLAQSAVDVGSARRLIAAGCPAETATRILL